MSAERAVGSGASRDTLLLYCPYDRRITRHMRRGLRGDVACIECGRKIDVGAAEHAGTIAPLQPERPLASPRRARVRRLPLWRRRAPSYWVPFALVALVTTVAAASLVTTLAKPTAAPARTTPSATSASASAAEPALDVQASTSSGETTIAGTEIHVANTGGVGAYVRRTPDMNDRIRAWRDGTALTVLGPDTTANGIEWKHVEDPAGNQGWIPAQYTTH
ncbi:MAG TPA: hypothetical protein VFC51_18010 [Chloroflexota bacterium]|nr:hypothetical protein [Chloroflexota bacterium]